MDRESSPGTNRVLLVDDDVKLCQLVAEYLRREGMEVEVVHDGQSGVRQAQSGQYSVVVLDVMLPGIGGFDVLRHIRSTAGAVARLPVLMLTARGDEVDRVLGLELGADDYLPKPFSSRELVARLRAILRRTHNAAAAGATAGAPGKLLHVGDLALNRATREVHRGSTSIDLTSSEFELLELLLRAAGEIVTRQNISEAALGRTLLPYDRSIDVHVSNLRRKLGPDRKGSERIKAVRGVGYIYVASHDEYAN